jgi:DNA-binding response OmpR family regulator
MKKILIVEDDQRIATALVIRLKANGYDPSVATDVLTGSRLARTIKPDLILLDVCLPAGNGFQLAKDLQCMPQNSATPIFIMTASKNPELQQQALESGAIALFEKPFDIKKLLGSIDRELNGAADAPNEREAPVAQPIHVNHGRILVIEDDRKIAMALTLRLKSAGYEATAAYDALTGVNSALNNPTDLVLLDISLPAGDGFAAAEKIQTLSHASIPIIFITASKQPGYRERAMELGAAGYFEKPYEAEKLLAAIQKVFHPQDLILEPK